MSASNPTSSYLGQMSYKLTSNLFEVDASAGLVSVVNNSKFNTNCPIDKALAITEVDWLVNMLQAPTMGSAAQEINWLVIGQLTEALARTTPTLADNVDVDIYQDEMAISIAQATAVGDAVAFWNRQKVLERHVFRHPWLTVAQQLNLIGQVTPGESNGQNGPEMQFGVRIFFQLVDLNADLRTYLATRLQISGQA